MKKSQVEFLAVSLLLLLVGVVYWPTITHDFIALDDVPRIRENLKLRELSWATVRWAFSGESTSLYALQPLTWLSLAVDVSLFGPEPAALHAVNLALHATNAALLLVLLWRMTGLMLPSAMAAAGFAVHPLTVEPVAWATERNTLLASLFAVIAMHAHISFTRRPSIGRYAGVFAAFVSSLLAKPWLFGLPLALLALDAWPLGRFGLNPDPHASRPRRRVVLEKLPLLVMACLWAFVAINAMQHGPAAIGTATAAKPLLLRVAYAPIAVVRYLAKLVIPANLAVHYPYPEHVPGWQVVGAFVIVAALTGLAIAWRVRAPSLLVGWMWFLVFIAPTLGVIQAGSWPAIADRFAYMSIVGPLVAIAFESFRVAQRPVRRWIGLTATVLAVAAFAVISRQQLGYWRDTITLLTHSAAVEPGSALVEGRLGHELGVLGKYAEAEVLLRRAMRVIDTSEIHNDLGNVLLLTGRGRAASEEYERAVARDPRNAEALFNLARALEAQGRSADARHRLMQFLEVAPPSLDPVRHEVRKALGAPSSEATEKQ